VKWPDYELKTEEREGYLHARITAERDSYELTLAAVLELAGFCRERGALKLLVEHDVPGALPAADVFKIASELPGLYRGITVAFIIHRPTDPLNPGFLETVARNRGATGRLFTDPAEAERWLLDAPPSREA
jgi:hypothetical protein